MMKIATKIAFAAVFAALFAVPSMAQSVGRPPAVVSPQLGVQQVAYTPPKGNNNANQYYWPWGPPPPPANARNTPQPAPATGYQFFGGGLDPKFYPQVVDYPTKEGRGTIIVDTPHKFLYLVLGNGKAKRYGIGVGRPGFTWSGVHEVTRKAEWPDWRPPAEMIVRERVQNHRIIPAYMPGGEDNPLGARALYLGSTLYRIHGTSEPWTIGTNVSSGCIRLRNEDVIDLYNQVSVGTRVIVM